MRKRQIRLVAKIFGMTMPVGLVKVGTLAWERKAETVKVCPNCGRPTRGDDKKAPVGTVIEYSQEYNCACGYKTGWWGNLTEKIKATGEVLKKPLLTAPKEIPDVLLWKYPLEKYRLMVSGMAKDSPENAIIPADAATGRNISKLIIATEVLGQVIVAKFPDYNVERVVSLSLNPDGTVILRELIPSNLVEFNDEVMKIDKAQFTPQEIEEAKAFLANIPEAQADVFAVNDWRTIGLGAEVESPKVLELNAILAQAGKQAEAVASA